MPPSRRSRCPRRGRAWLPLLLAALWCLTGRTVLPGSPTDGNSATHLVREGDTIPRLCWQYRVRAEAIRAANPGVDDPLPVGRRLVIPTGGPATAPAPASAASAAASRPPGSAATREAFLAAVQAPAAASRAAAHDPTPGPAPPPGGTGRLPAVRTPRNAPVPAVVETPPVVTTTRLPPAPVDAPRPTAAPAVLVSTGPPVALPPSVPAGRSAAAAPNFEDAARWLMARNIRYDENWTPPGEREPWEMDCSNTVRWLYRTVAGVDLPRTASDQYESLRQRGRAWEVPPGNDGLPDTDYIIAHLRMGDLLFWENTYEPVRSPNITHVMILLGEDSDHHWKMTGSQTRDGVSIYEFDPQATKGGYTSLLGNVYHPGRFVAYGRP